MTVDIVSTAVVTIFHNRKRGRNAQKMNFLLLYWAGAVTAAVTNAKKKGPVLSPGRSLVLSEGLL